MTSERKALQDLKKAEDFKNEALSIVKTHFAQNRELPLYFDSAVPSDRRSRFVLDQIFFRQQIIHNLDPSTELDFLGYSLQTPIMIAPMASMATMVENGIGKMCDATRDTGSLTWVAFYPQEYYAQHAKTNPIVYIEKPLADREKLLSKLKIAEQAGCIALGVDVDSGGDNFHRPASPRFGSLKPLSIEELKQIRQKLAKPFIIKGVLSKDDAAAALESGADIIVVSNHYGTKLDFAQAPLEVLPEIVDAVGDKVDILVDGQIRTGSDILKILAMGGKAVLIGRPIYWAALVGGAAGIAHLIRLLTEELRRAMLYTGVENVTKVPQNILVHPR